jgi:xanthine dehydrogenase accessory factor
MELYAQMARLGDEGRGFVLATVVEVAGSTPQKPGAKMLVVEDGSLIGTVGGGAIELQIVDAARALLGSAEQHRTLDTQLTHELGMCCGGRMKVFLEKHGRAAELYLFGGGHVGQALCRLAAEVGFRVTVVDERPRWAERARFPAAHQVLLEDPVEVARRLPLGPQSYLCIATHDHALDQAILEAVLRKPAAYHGVIGSRRKAERFKARLRAAGFGEEELARVRSPMGLPIHALTPAEIAVSIVAELIHLRRAPGPS